MGTDEAITRFFLRSLVSFYLLLPVGLSSMSAAFSVVAEKQQRTLEPILATPITDLEFLIGKTACFTCAQHHFDLGGCDSCRRHR
jgi:ABC-type Na+ efflux pump permease subunit